MKESNKKVVAEVMALNTQKADKLVEKFVKAMETANKSLWNVAKVAHDTVTAKDFKQCFGTLENYAEQIGMKKANVSKLVKAYKTRLYLTDSMGNEMPDFTTTQIVEMSPVDDVDKVEFIEANNITEDTTAKEIRECAKAWKSVEDETVETETETEGTGETETETTNNTPMIITYGEMEIEITDRTIIDKMIQLLVDNNINVTEIKKVG